MKQEIKNKKITIDFINMLLGLAMIGIAVVAFSQDMVNYKFFPVIFSLGTVMMVLNANKYFRNNKILGSLFGVMSVVLACGLILSLLELM